MDRFLRGTTLNGHSRLEGSAERRITSILAQIPHSESILEIGCGANPGKGISGYIGLDLDFGALKSARQVFPALPLLQANGINLPFPRDLQFDLILVRHPDIDKHSDSWRQIFQEIPSRFSKYLLVTAYSAHEIEDCRRWLLTAENPLTPLILRNLAPTSLGGEDRFVLAYQNLSKIRA